MLKCLKTVGDVWKKSLEKCTVQDQISTVMYLNQDPDPNNDSLLAF